MRRLFSKIIFDSRKPIVESDIIYVLKIDELNDIQLKKLTVLAHYSFESYDYCFLILEMERRGLLNAGVIKFTQKLSMKFNEFLLK